MAIKFEKLKAGSILLDIHSERAGNTMMRRLGCWKVRVLEIQEHGVIASWNGNRPEFMSKHQVQRLHLKPTKAYLRQHPDSKVMGKL